MLPATQWKTRQTPMGTTNTSRPKTSPPRPRFPRQIPDDAFLRESEEAIQQALTTGDVSNQKRIALRFAPTRTEVAFKLWIPCGAISRSKKLFEVLHELGNATQPTAWQDAKNNHLLRDFRLIPGMGIDFVCTSFKVASALSCLELSLFGSSVRIARFSSFSSRYWVDLVRLPDGITDNEIYDWFQQRGCLPSSIRPSIDSGLPSNQRTVYFSSDKVPTCLFQQNTPVREIAFPDPSDPHTLLRPCIVTHRLSKYNKVTPPSLRPQSKTPGPKTPQTFNSSLLANLAATRTPQASPSVASDSSMPQAALPPSESSILDSADDASLSDFSDMGDDTSPALQKVLIVPTAPPTDSHYQLVTRASYIATDQLIGPIQHIPHSNIRVLDNTMDFEFPITPNVYEPLWIDHCDPDVPISAFDLDMHEHEDSQVPCSGFLDAPSPTTLPAIQKSAICFDVGSMSRANLFDFIDDFLANVLDTNQETTLLRMAAQPSLFARPFFQQLHNAHSDPWTRSHSLYRAYGSTFSSLFASFTAFRDTATYTDLIQTVQDETIPGTRHTLYLATWDLFLLITAPNVYFDPLKVQHLIKSNAVYLAGTLVPLLTDETLVLLARSAMGTALLMYSTTLPPIKTALSALAAHPPSFPSETDSQDHPGCV